MGTLLWDLAVNFTAGQLPLFAGILVIIAAGSWAFFRTETGQRLSQRRREGTTVYSVVFFAAIFLVGGTLALAGWFTIEAVGRKPESVSFVVECRMGNPPRVIPPEGRVLIMAPAKLKEETSGSGILEVFGDPGSPAAVPPVNSAMSYRCELVSYAAIPLFDVAVTFNLRFKQEDPRVSGAFSGVVFNKGDAPVSRTWTFRQPHVAPQGHVVFYAFNNWIPEYIEITVRDASYRTSARSDPLTAKVTMAGSFGERIVLSPAVASPSPQTPASPEMPRPPPPTTRVPLIRWSDLLLEGRAVIVEIADDIPPHVRGSLLLEGESYITRFSKESCEWESAGTIKHPQQGTVERHTNRAGPRVAPFLGIKASGTQTGECISPRDRRAVVAGLPVDFNARGEISFGGETHKIGVLRLPP